MRVLSPPAAAAAADINARLPACVIAVMMDEYF